jgi:hypothetical protein
MREELEGSHGEGRGKDGETKQVVKSQSVG